MKKVLTIILSLLTITSVALAALTTHEQSSVDVRTNKRVDVTYDGSADSTAIMYQCYRVNATGDTIFALTIYEETADTTLTGLSSHTIYEFFTVARQADSTTVVSAKDTVSTYKDQLQDIQWKAIMSRLLMTDASWPWNDGYQTLDTTFDLSGSGATDNTCLFYINAYNGVLVNASQAGDSCAATIYYRPVYIKEDWADTTFTVGSVVDSTQISGPGITVDSLELPVGLWYQAFITTYDGNGKDADYELTLTSISDAER